MVPQPVPQVGRFDGVIGRVLAESEAWFEEPPHPGEDAPNVVVILIDDLGFGHFGCYGSSIATPKESSVRPRNCATPESTSFP